MGFPEVKFRVVENRKCPHFNYGDTFCVTGIAIAMKSDEDNSYITTSVVHTPYERKSCKILNADLTRLIIQYERGDKIPVCMINCSGCTGSIRLEHNKDDLFSLEDNDAILSDELASMMNLLSGFAFFKSIDQNNLDKVMQYFRMKTFKSGDIIIRKGEVGGNFFIIASGSVSVLNEGGIAISTLSKGDVFGEMSLICNERVSATIQVKEPASILYIDRDNFTKIIDRYPTVQLYFSRIMANRLNKSNTIRAADLSSGMIGNLSDIPAEALFQTLNMNCKTGILTINELSKGTARFSFRQGSLIKAKYAELSGESAFYEILKEYGGRFRFTPGIPPEEFETPEIGYFMKLLMEGMRRLDEVKPRPTN
ncbi:cyclic nucleotide-binding domain-containing protein [Desulfopila inferna]|uniref:cyclic nucleotide-binding domain-containing protein n=1 Tax=Desulfopila inferna TaxID=468528 RepID=UPI001963B3DF|nr:cyclic nucleotide-binding domain-containing protein [Desulfopila inferna]MBM9602640.1 cyclic nucleotide-binding domain-containing protein [Desulfopila inferna]